MSSILVLSILIIFSFSISIIIDRFGIPRISTYVVLGVIFSKDLIGNYLHSVELNILADSTVLTNICLSLIAFFIGAEVNLKEVKTLGKVILFGTIGQVLGAVLVVFTGFYFISKVYYIPGGLTVPIILAAIATTTAPASTIGIIDEYKAKGVITSLLLGIVILDDAFGIIIFEFMTSLITSGSIQQNLLHALKEILSSIGIGAILGASLGIISRKCTEEDLRFPFIFGFILLCASVTSLLNLSPLLASMVLGVTAQITSSRSSDELVLPIKHIEEFVFILFYVTAGLHFNFEVFNQSIVLIICYIILRAIGKYLGAWIGTSVNGTSKQARKLVGLGLFPQAGVAIGLSLSIVQKEELAQY